MEPGQTVAIVGPTGAGKTTLMKLLMRFYDVNAGSITVDGVDLRDYARDDLRENFAMVLQDTWLFKGSIMENIRYGRASASDDEVHAAARAALADHFIRTLPGGYDFELNEDRSSFSPSRARSSPTAPSSSWTRQLPTWTRAPRSASSAPWMPSCRVARAS